MNGRTTQALAVSLMGVAVLLAALAVRQTQPPQRLADEAPAAPAATPALLVRPTLISPELLAQFVMRRRADQVIVDLRAPESYARWHLPRARNMSPLEVATADLQALTGGDPDLELVLYGEDTPEAFDAAAELLRRGHEHVHVLDGGLQAFRAQVLTPPSLRGVLSEARARDAELVWRARRQFLLEGGAAVRGAASDPEQLSGPALVSTAWLEGQLDGVVPVDARPAEDYARGHVPGAVSLPDATVRGEVGGVPSLLLPAADLSRRLAALGVGADAAVAVYAQRPHDATLLALALLRAGQTRVAVVEGGWASWLAEGRRVSAATPTSASLTRPAADPDDFTVDTAQVQALARAGALVLDVRRPAEFAGEEGAVAGRAGHVPGAVNHPFTLDFAPGPQGLHWKDLAALRQAYQALGATPEREVVVYCRSGHRASSVVFTLRVLLGYPHVRWYDGSWKAWAAAADTEVQTGQERP